MDSINDEVEDVLALLDPFDVDAMACSSADEKMNIGRGNESPESKGVNEPVPSRVRLCCLLVVR